MKNIAQFEFKKFNESINDRILEEYERLTNELNSEDLVVLASLILMGKRIKPVTSKRLENERKSVNTYISKVFTDFQHLINFMHKENIPFDLESCSKYSSISSFAKYDTRINQYINSLDIDELYELKQKILRESQFSKSLVEAIKSTESEAEVNNISSLSIDNIKRIDE